MRFFFPNARIKNPPTAGRDIKLYQFVKNIHELGHEGHSLTADDSGFTKKHSRFPWSVLRQLRAADVMYCRVEYEPNHATDLTLPRTAWLVPRHTVVVWEFNVALNFTPHAERTQEDIDRATAHFRRSAGRVDLAIGVTKHLADEARELIGIQQAYVVENGSDPEMFRRDLPRPPGFEPRGDRLNVTFIASGPNSYHDAPLIRDTAALVSRDNMPIDFHIFGDSQDLFPQGTAPSICHHGRISYLELPKYLAAMDVGLVLMRQHAEGSPLKLFDYLASGCVPICSPSQPNHEVLDGTEAGFVRQWTPASLCETLLELHHDRPRLERMRAIGRQIIIDKYSWLRLTEQTVEIINEARGRRV